VWSRALVSDGIMLTRCTQHDIEHDWEEVAKTIQTGDLCFFKVRRAVFLGDWLRTTHCGFVGAGNECFLLG
jgi:hypothetical protein